MKFLVGLCILVVVAPAVYGNKKCSLGVPSIPEGWVDLSGNCLTAVRTQIQMEIDASYKYLAMGAYFSQDTVNRPGFAEMFFKSAKEEREHGMKLIEYLSMRGVLNKSITDLIHTPTIQKDKWENGAEALEDALKLEIEVTTAIRNIIGICDQKPYYHLSDYLTGVFLEEQLQGQRELAGKLTSLKKMMMTHGDLGEFLFDKDL